jgi:hypothetical protein
MSTHPIPRPSITLKAKNTSPTPSAQAHPREAAKIPNPPSLLIAEIPYRLKRLEPVDPAKIINEDPVLDTLDAAAYLGVQPSRLQKWRQRDEGPIYLSYEGDYIRYELSELVVFRAAHRVRPSRHVHVKRGA